MTYGIIEVVMVSLTLASGVHLSNRVALGMAIKHFNVGNSVVAYMSALVKLYTALMIRI